MYTSTCMTIKTDKNRIVKDISCYLGQLITVFIIDTSYNKYSSSIINPYSIVGTLRFSPGTGTLDFVHLKRYCQSVIGHPFCLDAQYTRSNKNEPQVRIYLDPPGDVWTLIVYHSTRACRRVKFGMEKFQAIFDYLTEGKYPELDNNQKRNFR